MTSRRVGSGRTGIESAKVRLVFSSRSARLVVAALLQLSSRPPRCARRPRDDRSDAIRSPRRPGRDEGGDAVGAVDDASAHPESTGIEPGWSERAERHGGSADSSLGVHAPRKISGQLLLGGVATIADDQVGDTVRRRPPEPRPPIPCRRPRADGTRGAAAAAFSAAVTRGRSTDRSVPCRAPGLRGRADDPDRVGPGRPLPARRGRGGHDEIADRQVRRQPAGDAGPDQERRPIRRAERGGRARGPDGPVSGAARRRRPEGSRGVRRTPRAPPGSPSRRATRGSPTQPRTYPFARNHSTARASGSSTGVCGRPSSRTALPASKNIRCVRHAHALERDARRPAGQPREPAARRRRRRAGSSAAAAARGDGQAGQRATSVSRISLSVMFAVAQDVALADPAPSRRPAGGRARRRARRSGSGRCRRRPACGGSGSRRSSARSASA